MSRPPSTPFERNGFTVTALQAAWWAIHSTRHIKGPDHVEAALQAAISLGYDTDTVAAIAGALLGARYGVSGLPSDLARRVHGWPGLRGDDLVALALATAGARSNAEWVATRAHAGQVDKAGLPYIEHPRRVAALVAQVTTDEDAVAAAWLHDVVEDTSASLDELRQLGFSERVVDAVGALTRRPGEGDEYYRRVAANPIALVVKRCDIADNTDPTRVALLSSEDAARLRAKYDRALHLLAEGSGA